MHFSHQHSWHSIIILGEGNQPLPRCPQYANETVKRAHPNPDMCWHKLERKIWNLVFFLEKEEHTRTGFLGVRDVAEGSTFIQVIGINFVVLRQQLASGGYTLGTGKVGMNGEYFGERGVR